MCHLSHVTCQMSLTPTATAANPSSANPPTMQIGLFVKTKKTVGQFYPPFEQKYEVLTPLYLYYFGLKNNTLDRF